MFELPLELIVSVFIDYLIQTKARKSKLNRPESNCVNWCKMQKREKRPQEFRLVISTTNYIDIHCCPYQGELIFTRRRKKNQQFFPTYKLEYMYKTSCYRTWQMIQYPLYWFIGRLDYRTESNKPFNYAAYVCNTFFSRKCTYQLNEIISLADCYTFLFIYGCTQFQLKLYGTTQHRQFYLLR